MDEDTSETGWRQVGMEIKSVGMVGTGVVSAPMQAPT